MLPHDFGDTLPIGSRCVYSYWHGYLKRAEWQATTAKLREAGGDLLECHTSGHIHVADWIQLIKSLHPRTIFPIHTNVPEKFRQHFDNVRVLADWQGVEIE